MLDSGEGCDGNSARAYDETPPDCCLMVEAEEVRKQRSAC